jgi:hypothetical protein
MLKLLLLLGVLYAIVLLLRWDVYRKLDKIDREMQAELIRRRKIADLYPPKPTYEERMNVKHGRDD